MQLLPLALVLATLVAFAANSILCRFALGDELLDPMSFAFIRIASGALMLAVLFRGRGTDERADQRPGYRSAGWLVVYALPFSLAYTQLDTGMGALLLFGAVQLTMFAHGIRAGERPTPFEWVGLIGAGIGLVYLVLPGLTAPDPLAAAAMVAAGVGWGMYSLAGRDQADAFVATRINFQRAAVAMAPLMLLALPFARISTRGALIAVLSGGVASALGYVIWYAALRYLTATRAALVQLLVPVIAAAGGVVLLAEQVSLRLVLGSTLILLSIAAAILHSSRRW